MTEDEALQQVAQVIEKTNDLELRIALVLSQCLMPSIPDYGFLRELIFHNSLIGFSAKVQLIERILDYWSWKDLKKSLGPFRELMKFRNAFAHTPLAKRQLLVYFSTDSDFGTPLGSEFVVEKKTPTSWENVERETAFKLFYDLHGKCMTVISEIEERIKKTIAQHPVPPYSVNRGGSPQG